MKTPFEKSKSEFAWDCIVFVSACVAVAKATQDHLWLSPVIGLGLGLALVLVSEWGRRRLKRDGDNMVALGLKVSLRQMRRTDFNDPDYILMQGAAIRIVLHVLKTLGQLSDDPQEGVDIETVTKSVARVMD